VLGVALITITKLEENPFVVFWEYCMSVPPAVKL